ncbi:MULTISPECIES: hypothetical protein [Pandoraea]|uniref:STAS domain-containing protein n=1 Tax=Pandoraea soli TaxID=2508293 RepID=A0ABY6VZC1_9BURK|nr:MULTISPECIES: hypothetical protein [Pandoraea]VVE07337.1 hypothetical protein PSO31014_02431 [Pandoraea soli]
MNGENRLEGWTTIPLQSGLEVAIDRRDGLIWISLDEAGVTVAFCLDALADAGFDGSERTLSIAFNAGVGFLELPCTANQAKKLFDLAGWDNNKLEAIAPAT